MIISLNRQGYTRKDICKKLFVCESTLYLFIKEKKLIMI